MATIRRRGILALATLACTAAAIVPVSAATAGAATAKGAAATASRTDTKAEASQECKAKLRKNKAAFAKRYGGTGAKALNRCVKAEMNDTHND